MSEFFVVAPLCGCWVAVLRAESGEEAAVRAFMAMAVCGCDLASARWVGEELLHGRDLLGWTFVDRGCRPETDA